MSRFLNLVSYQTAKTILSESARLSFQIQKVPVTKAVGHAAAESVYSRYTVPNCDISIRDGFAVRSSDTLDASDSCPVIISQYENIHTGSIVLERYDTIVPLEDARIMDDEHIAVIKPVRPGQNIQRAGSEIKEGRMIMHKGHYILPEDTGCLISYGILNLSVRVVVAGIIPTGDELVEPYSAPSIGEVVESNCITITGLLENIGIKTILYPLTRDDPDKIRTVLEQAVNECNFIIISGGTSSGKRDYTRDVLCDLGTLLFHGVAIRPGKTTIAGVINGKPVFGLPGTPVGSVTILRELILAWLTDEGYPVPVCHKKDVKLIETIASNPGVDDFVLMMVGKAGDGYIGMPAGRGRGQFSRINANGILQISRDREGSEAGKIEKVLIFRPSLNPDNTLLFMGVYDPLLDYLDLILQEHGIRIMVREGSPENAILTLIKGNLHGGVIRREWTGGEFKLKSNLPLAGFNINLIKVGEIGNLSGDILNKRESIDLAIRCECMNNKEILLLKQILNSDEWKDISGELPGYLLDNSGEVTTLI